MPCDDDVGTAAKLSASCGWQLVECAQPRTLHLVSAAARRVRAKPSVGCSFYSTDYAVRAVAHATVMYRYTYTARIDAEYARLVYRLHRDAMIRTYMVYYIHLLYTYRP